MKAQLYSTCLLFRPRLQPHALQAWSEPQPGPSVAAPPGSPAVVAGSSCASFAFTFASHFALLSGDPYTDVVFPTGDDIVIDAGTSASSLYRTASIAVRVFVYRLPC